MYDKLILSLATVVSLLFIFIKNTDPVYTFLIALASVFIIMCIQDIISKGRKQDDKNL